MSDTIFGSADFSDIYPPRGGHIDPSWWIYRSITVSIYTYHDEYIALLSSLKKLNALKALPPWLQPILAGGVFFCLQPLSPSSKAFANKTETAETGL
ncbi:hypothetical protein [Bacteroides acidifaciens]|uniref:hypothetical protein n=1 Tax=Bacteroides acidifaciens TaxID=85831 RepID=UPI0025AA1C0F|nr:hypothetical protein [Bacteroides acidifaciens]